MAMKMPTTYGAEEAEGGGAPIQPQHMLNWSCGCDRHHVRNHLAMASTHASCWVAFTAPFKAALHNNLLPLKGLPGLCFFAWDNCVFSSKVCRESSIDCIQLLVWVIFFILIIIPMILHNERSHMLSTKGIALMFDWKTFRSTLTWNYLFL